MSDIFLPQNGVAGGSGNVTNKTQRITVATDDVNLAAINTNVAALANNNTSFESSEITVTTSYTTLSTITTGTYEHIGIEISSNAGSVSALSELIVQVKDHADGSWYSMIGNSDFADTSNPVLIFATSSPRPDQVDAGETGHFRLHIDKAYSIRVRAKTAAGTALITCRGYSA